MNKLPLTVAGVVFAVVALIHLSRLFFHFSVAVDGVDIPLWANVLGFVFAGGLSWWMFASARKE